MRIVCVVCCTKLKIKQSRKTTLYFACLLNGAGFFAVWKESHQLKSSETILHWEILPENSPAIIHNCQKCGNQSRFVCSDNFRVNAHQKQLDVWLIYRCEKCDKTLNLTLFSRINPKALNKDILHKATHNDREYARQISFDYDLLKRNGMVPDYGSVRYKIKGAPLILGAAARVYIHCRVSTGIRADRLLPEMMVNPETNASISREQFKRLVKSGMIRCENGETLGKMKISGDLKLIIGNKSGV